VPPAADPGAAREAVAALDAMRARVASVEEDLFAALAVLGEPLPQRTLDDWLDQAVDALRAVAEEAVTQRSVLSRYAVGPAASEPGPAASEPAPAASRRGAAAGGRGSASGGRGSASVGRDSASGGRSPEADR
jgi:hypothetical protein